MVLQVCGHRQIALAHIDASDAHDALTLLGCGVRGLPFQAHQQLELLARLVVPSLRCADAGAVLDKRHMPRVAGGGQDDTPLQR